MVECFSRIHQAPGTNSNTVRRKKILDQTNVVKTSLLNVGDGIWQLMVTASTVAFTNKMVLLTKRFQQRKLKTMIGCLETAKDITRMTEIRTRGKSTGVG